MLDVVPWPTAGGVACKKSGQRLLGHPVSTAIVETCLSPPHGHDRDRLAGSHGSTFIHGLIPSLRFIFILLFFGCTSGAPLGRLKSSPSLRPGPVPDWLGGISASPEPPLPGLGPNNPASGRPGPG